jgi:hypothetical protein
MTFELHQSMLNSWLKCGVQFRRRYIEGEVIPPGIAARRGQGSHKGAEVNHRQKIKSKIDLPVSDLQDAARDEFVHVVKERGVFIPKNEVSGKNRLLNEGLNQVVEAMVIYHQDIAPHIQPVMVEERLSAEIEGFPMSLGGILDVSDEQGRVIDLKIMKRQNQVWADRQLQPTFYYLLYKAATGEFPKQFNFECVVPNKEMVHSRLVTERNERDFRVLRRIIEVFQHDLQTGVFRPAMPDHWACTPQFCGYYQTCKYARR